MNRLCVFCALLISSSVFALPRMSYFDLNLDYGGLQTANSDYAPYPSSYYKYAHQVGGLGFGADVGYLFDSYQLSLPYEWRVGAEAGYNQFADNTYSYNFGFTNSQNYTTTYSAYALSFLGVVRYQNTNGWMLFFKTGVARVVQSLSSSNQSSANTLPTKADFSPEFVFGSGYQFSTHINANASYVYIMGKAPALGSNTSVAPVSYLRFTLGYSF